MQKVPCMAIFTESKRVQKGFSRTVNRLQALVNTVFSNKAIHRGWTSSTLFFLCPFSRPQQTVIFENCIFLYCLFWLQKIPIFKNQNFLSDHHIPHSQTFVCNPFSGYTIAQNSRFSSPYPYTIFL